MGDPSTSHDADLGPIEVSLPFTGPWAVRNSPARRVPSHGSELFGERYAIDFIAVDDRHRSALTRDWHTVLGTEPAQRFFAFGKPILAPSDGTVVAVHDGELDHVARRSQLALLPYALGQASRLRRGIGAIAGNYVVIALAATHTYLTMVHLQQGSVRVRAGDELTRGQHLANCGNSGNSTQPHVHVQATDSPDLHLARGVPLVFRDFREWPSNVKQVRIRQRGVPGEGSVVESLAGAAGEPVPDEQA